MPRQVVSGTSIAEFGTFFVFSAEQLKMERIPQEIWEHIFSYLKVIHLCQLCLVSKHMYETAQNPNLWSKFIMNLTPNMFKKFKVCSTFFKATRTKKITSLSVIRVKLNAKNAKILFRAVLNSDYLKCLDLSNSWVVQSPKSLFGKSIASILKVKLNGTKMSAEQWLSVLENRGVSPNIHQLDAGDGVKLNPKTVVTTFSYIP